MEGWRLQCWQKASRTPGEKEGGNTALTSLGVMRLVQKPPMFKAAKRMGGIIFRILLSEGMMTK